MKINRIFSIVIVIFLIGLLINTAFQINIAQTKNKHLLAFEKAKIDSFENIDALKFRAKEILEKQNDANNESRSNKITEVYVIVGLIIMQVVLAYKSKAEDQNHLNENAEYSR